MEVSPLVTILLAALYGITMKVADLLDEHGLRWFQGSAVLFGLAWGVAGSLLVLADPAVANVMAAMNLAFLLRGRLDYPNHQLATTLILLTFLISGTFSLGLFLPFYVIFLSFGWLKDYVDDKLKVPSSTLKLLTESMLYYPVPTLIYSYITDQWLVFGVFLVFTATYDATKLIAYRRGYR